MQATPLILTGLAAAIAFRAGVWNIGGEGQFFAGTIGTWWVYDMWGGLPAPLLSWPCWSQPRWSGPLGRPSPAASWSAMEPNEILTTVMLNFVILKVLSYLLAGPWQSPNPYYQTERMAANTFLPRFFSDSRLHWGFAIALLAAVAVRFLIRRTTLGYEIRGVGANVVAGRYKGIKG